jgi:hypothetical protein
MASLAASMPAIDSSIFDAIGETLFSGTDEATGIFRNGYREIEYSNGTIVGLHISFDCQWQSWMAELVEGAAVRITYPGSDKPDENYRFIRRVPSTGDESGLIVLELGTVLE